jgi:hypothetical protein
MKREKKNVERRPAAICDAWEEYMKNSEYSLFALSYWVDIKKTR